MHLTFSLLALSFPVYHPCPACERTVCAGAARRSFKAGCSEQPEEAPVEQADGSEDDSSVSSLDAPPQHAAPGLPAGPPLVEISMLEYVRHRSEV